MLSYAYVTCCVNVPMSEVDDLNEMIWNERDITRATFMRKCGRAARDIFRQLGYEDHPAHGLTSARDFHIRYYSSKFRGKRCYFFRWSAIEYIFQEQEVWAC